MKELIRKAEELLAELKAKELVEHGTEIADDSKVELSALNAGQRFKTGIGNFIVLGHDETGTKVIQEDFFEDDVKFDSSSPDYTKSDLKEKFDTEILEAYEKEFGAGNLVEHEIHLQSIDMQDYGSFTCKVRPITFDEAREFNEFLVKPELPSYYWTCTPWSTKERGWEYSEAVVSPHGRFDYWDYNNYDGVRPVCILKSNIFVSKVEE